MGRKRDDRVREEFEKTNDGITKCKHCRAEFRGKPSVTRLRSHLLGIAGGGIRSCTLVPEHVKNALADASTSSKIPRIDEACQHVEDMLQRSSASADYRWDNTSALCRTMAGFENCINNSASTSARQQNNESENQMQADKADQAVVRDTDQEDQADQTVVRGTDQDECSAMPKSSGDGEPFPTEKLVGAAFKTNMDTVLEWLTSDEVLSIGIYGMGGVGKTTLLTHIYNRILEDKSKFGAVCWITVSQDFSIERLQNLIANRIHLEFGNEEDFKNRAAKLLKELRRKGKFVLILDDLWNHFDVKKMGIPIEVNGCKLIVTTRSLEVCRRINCQKKLKVERLLEEEARKLFLETLGHDLAPGVEQIAKSIVGECAGLPLGIVTMAGSMRQEDDIHEWENALTELQQSEVRNREMEDEVFKILRFSYAHLKDTALQKCLLYCSLYPEDYAIEKNELIEGLICEGIIEIMDSRKQAFNKGYTMLNALENSCLLGRSRFYHDDGGAVKMHDLIRDMAIQIMKECSPSLVQAGKRLTSLPGEKWWTENIVKVSLMNNDIREISSHYSPRCPNLSTLILSYNRRMQSIAEAFFYQLHGLKVLNLSWTKIEKLPESVGDLETLTALILRHCGCLTSLPLLRKLKALEKLDLYRCTEFEKVPEGLELLFNLNYLDLRSTGIEDLPAGILTNLYHLQYLGFSGSSSRNLKAEEVERLRKLETLCWRFNDQEDFNNYIHSLSNMHMEKLSQISLLVGPKGTDNEIELIKKWDQNESCFRLCNVSRELLLPKDVQKLDIYNVKIHNGKSLCLKNAIDLKRFHIFGCKEIEYLFCSSSSPSIFETLEDLMVYDMEKLRGFFSKDGDDGVIPPTPIPIQLPTIATFSRLKNFSIIQCYSMKKLFPCALLSNLQNLQRLYVSNCPEMEEIIAAEEEEGSSSYFTFIHALFTLPNLRELTLKELPKLKSICNAKLKCDSLEFVLIRKVPKLKKIPVCLDNTIISSLKKINVDSKEWWALVEWVDPIDKAALQQIVHFRYK